MVCVFVYKSLLTQDHPCAEIFNFDAGNYNTKYNNTNDLTVPRINSNTGRQGITFLVLNLTTTFLLKIGKTLVPYVLLNRS